MPPSYSVSQCAAYLAGRIPVCTRHRLPQQLRHHRHKAFEAADAVRNGADEIDMVINLGWVGDGCWSDLLEEIRQVKASCQGKVLKVIVETCLLTREEKNPYVPDRHRSRSRLYQDLHRLFHRGATREDVALFAQQWAREVRSRPPAVSPASRTGKISWLWGAHRLGTSRIVKLVKAEEANVSVQ